MIVFCIAAAVLAACAGSLILNRALGGVEAAPVDPTVHAYRRAMAEIDELSDRDLLAPSERGAARSEAARRLLTAAEQQEPPFTAGSHWTAIAAATIAPLVAGLIYLGVGSPGAVDQPFAARLKDWLAAPENYPPPALAAALRAIAAQRPADIEPLRRLAALDLGLGDADGAAHALRKAMTIDARRGDLPAALGEVLVLKDRGTIGPEAMALFERALALDPASATARYYIGRVRIAAGDTRGGLADWHTLLETLPAYDPRRPSLSRDIAAVEATGHLFVASPLPQTAQMSGAIRGMVEGLAARLRARPDDPDGWVRLVRAYAVLGDGVKNRQALLEARRRFAGNPEVLHSLDTASRAPSSLAPP